MKALGNYYKKKCFNQLNKILYEITTNDNYKLYSNDLKIFCELHNCKYSVVLGCKNGLYKSFNNVWTIKEYGNK